MPNTYSVAMRMKLINKDREKRTIYILKENTYLITYEVYASTWYFLKAQ